MIQKGVLFEDGVGELKAVGMLEMTQVGINTRKQTLDRILIIGYRHHTAALFYKIIFKGPELRSKVVHHSFSAERIPGAHDITQEINAVGDGSYFFLLVIQLQAESDSKK